MTSQRAPPDPQRRGRAEDARTAPAPAVPPTPPRGTALSPAGPGGAGWLAPRPAPGRARFPGLRGSPVPRSEPGAGSPGPAPARPPRGRGTPAGPSGTSACCGSWAGLRPGALGRGWLPPPLRTAGLTPRSAGAGVAGTPTGRARGSAPLRGTARGAAEALGATRSAGRGRGAARPGVAAASGPRLPR